MRYERKPAVSKARQVRRWSLVAGAVLGVLVAAVLGVYGWAWLSTDESTFARALVWRESYAQESTGSTSTYPDADAVLVRVGRDWGVGNIRWLATFRDVAATVTSEVAAPL